MKYSLRTLLITAMLGPPILAFLLAWIFRDLFGIGPVDLVPVEGRVTLNGKPVAGAAVMFTFDDGNFAKGITDQSGEYRLGFVGRVGCPPKPAKVWISSANARFGVSFPAQFTNSRQTPLTVTPELGRTNYVFLDLTSP